MELQNLPYVVLRELMPMLGIKEKQSLRLVSHRLRDLIDTQRNVHFNVTLSDATSSTVLRFNRFDLTFLPRILHRLNVTSLLVLKLSSTSSTRHPLPPSVHTLAFSETRGISQNNFLKLVNFYGKSDSLREVHLNLLCLEGVGSAKILRQGILQMNLIQKLELVFPTSMDPNIETALALLGGTFPSLQSLKIDLNPYGCYHPILYKTAFSMISRHLPGLSLLEMIQPEMYYPPGILKRLRNMFPARVHPFVPHIGDWETYRRVTLKFEDLMRSLKQFCKLDPESRVLEKFQQGSSTLKKLILGFSVLESLASVDENLAPILANCQKNLEFLELSLVNLPAHPAPPASLPDSAVHPLNLAKILKNCSSTLVTLKLLDCLLDTVDGDDQEFQFDGAQLESCSRLETFLFTWSNFDEGRQVRYSNLDKLPQSLRHLELPSQVLDEDLQHIRDRLINLKTFMFGYQVVTLPQFQVLLGNEGIKALDQVTLIKGFYDSGPIREWARDEENGLMIIKVRERFPLKSVYERKQRTIVIFKRGA